MTSRRFEFLFLRLAVAAVYLYHGVPKALDWGMAYETFDAMGFPGALGPMVGFIEVIAALLIASGVLHRWANYALAGIITVAIIGVQLPATIAAGSVVPGLERDILLLLGHFVLAWSGPGRFALAIEHLDECTEDTPASSSTRRLRPAA